MESGPTVALGASMCTVTLGSLSIGSTSIITRFPLGPVSTLRTTLSVPFSDDGLRFEREAGVRIAQESERETYAVYAPEVVRLGDGTYRMYYAAWTDKISGGVFTAVSHDGLDWVKEHRPCLDLGGPRDASMVSEPCVIELADGRSRMFYEARDAAGRCRILSATSTGRPRPG